MTTDETLARLQSILDGRLGTMTAVVNEATRSAALAAGAAMEVKGQLAGVQAGLQRVEDEQRRARETQQRHGEQIASISRTCTERGGWCNKRFDDASADLQASQFAVDRAWRDAVRGLHARAKRTSDEIDAVRAEATAAVQAARAEADAELTEVRAKLADVREDTGVRDMRELQRQSEERGRERVLALAAAARERRNARLIQIGKLAGKIALGLAGAGAGGFGLLKVLQVLLGG